MEGSTLRNFDVCGSGVVPMLLLLAMLTPKVSAQTITDVLKDPIDFAQRRDFLWEESFTEDSISASGKWSGKFSGENNRAGYVFPLFQGMSGALNIGQTGAQNPVDTTKFDLITYVDTVSVRDSNLLDGNNKRARRALYWTNTVDFPVAGT